MAGLRGPEEAGNAGQGRGVNSKRSLPLRALSAARAVPAPSGTSTAPAEPLFPARSGEQAGARGEGVKPRQARPDCGRNSGIIQEFLSHPPCPREVKPGKEI